MEWWTQKIKKKQIKCYFPNWSYSGQKITLKVISVYTIIQQFPQRQHWIHKMANYQQNINNWASVSLGFTGRQYTPSGRSQGVQVAYEEEKKKSCEAVCFDIPERNIPSSLRRSHVAGVERTGLIDLGMCSPSAGGNSMPRAFLRRELERRWRQERLSFQQPWLCSWASTKQSTALVSWTYVLTIAMGHTFVSNPL